MSELTLTPVAEAAHSKWSASGFEAIMLCPGKKVLEAGKPNSSSQYAAEGTAAHLVLTWAIEQHKPAADFIGEVIPVEGWTFVVDEDMARHVQVCVDYAKSVAGEFGVILADQRVNYSSYLDVPEQDAWGTLDLIVLVDQTIAILDFKYGMGVEVSATENPQLRLYALGAVAAHNFMGDDYTNVLCAISQPRISVTPSTETLTVEELEKWGRSTARSAVVTSTNALVLHGKHPEWAATFIRPGDKQCKFCRAKSVCPSLRDDAALTVYGSAPATAEEFETVTLPVVDASSDAAWLAAIEDKADLIDGFLKSVRGEIERRLLAGAAVPGYKVVQGKRGNRAWVDAKEVETTMKSMRIKIEDMYDFKLISPTAAEKLNKSGIITDRRWKTLSAQITQADGKPSVAPATDSRPALTVKPTVDEFEDMTAIDDLA